VALFLKYLVALCLGGLLGVAVTFLTVDRGIGLGAIRAGAWTGWPLNGLAEIDPYGRARLAHSRELPLGAAEGLSFIAKGDDSGAPFDPACDYLVKGVGPRARFWTLTLLSPEGFPFANRAQRYGFTSSEILRAADGAFEIIVSAEARPGNWLPIGGQEPFVLALRLYDTELDAGATALDTRDLPTVLKGSCR
jgi:hypothetical protein